MNEILKKIEARMEQRRSSRTAKPIIKSDFQYDEETLGFLKRATEESQSTEEIQQ